MAKAFELEPLDVTQLVKINDLKEITNPVFFNKFGQPSADGFLSNEIFGITKEDRSETYAYVDLGEDFISPPFYKAWARIDSKLSLCVHQKETFSIDKDGKLVIDRGKYESAAREYMKDLSQIEDLEEEVQAFRSK